MEISSIQRRFCAYLIDIIILMPAFLLLGLLQDFPSIVPHLLHMFIHCGYFTYFISSNSQATPGQQLMNICTIRVDSYKIDLGLAFNRTISQFFFPVLYCIMTVLMILLKEKDFFISICIILRIFIALFNLLWYSIACFSKKKQTFHDMLFNTLVITTRKH